MSNGSFGQTPVGVPLWTDQLWMTVPRIYREKDIENGGWFRLLVEAVGETFWAAHEYAQRLTLMRDAMRCEGGFAALTLTISSVEIVEAVDSEDGQPYVILRTEDNLLSVSLDWRVRGARDLYLRSVSAIGGYVTVFGRESPVEGGVIRVHPPSMLSWLARDYGTETDAHEPETYQRNLVLRTSYWQGLRGTEQGIVVRAKMGGFDATVRRLYRISEWFFNALPAESTWEIPVGSGKFYTDIEPRFLRFDEVAADVAPMDDLPPAEYTEEVVVSGVGGSGPSWVLSLAANAVGLVSAGNATWVMTLGGRSLYVDDVDLDAMTMTVTAGDFTPEVGTYTLRYSARRVPMLTWRPAHIVRIELEVIEDTMLADPVFLEDALTRVLAKLRRVTPAHVEFAQVVFVLRAGATVALMQSITGYLRQFSRYDEVVADVQATDLYTEEALG